jgi:aspartyl protease family protein
MRNIIIFLLFMFTISCGHDNTFSVSKIINGNTIELENGVLVTLEKVNNNQGNINILERYANGGVLLYDSNAEKISSFSSDQISAIVYNSDGDCINELLASVTEITNDKVPQVGSEPIPHRSVVPFEKDGGILIMKAIVNGVEMNFIFDTGASLVSISQSEADSLHALGKLNDEDLLGKGAFTDANGDISVGTIINLANVQIGDRVLNDVKACVTQGLNAPLLLGQSAMEKFGKVSIDYTTNEIIFE